MQADPSSSRRAVIAVVLLMLGLAPARAGDGKSWFAEIGTEVSHRDNFFFRAEQDGITAPSATLATLFGSGEVEIDTGENSWTFGGAVSGTTTNDIENADYGTADAAVEFKRRNTRGLLELGYAPNRIFSEEADGVFFDLATAKLGVRQGFARGFWFGVELGFQDWRFDPVDADRDARSQEVEATLRVPLGARAGMRLFGEVGEKDAVSPDYDWEGRAYGVAFEWNPGDRFSMFARVKRRDRDYVNAPSTDSNFERSDEALLGLLNMRYRIGRTWGLGAKVEYRDATSTRPDRNYDAGQVGVGMFFLL